ncbi:hypothetical protein MNBD_PLANCTO03-1531 [hydrothermal vent metagenome]|uniref:Uncharacterized protein n=1 Tax=hydrothermal vent metagenome TaxID=652676 RepID=A0A3B1DG31_9ZZZZ
MWSFTTIREQAAQSGGSGATRLFTVVQQQPSWITRVAFGVAVLVFTGVILLLVVPALIIAAMVFFLLALVSRAWRWMRSLFGFERSGRRHVRVISRQ